MQIRLTIPPNVNEAEKFCGKIILFVRKMVVIVIPTFETDLHPSLQHYLRKITCILDFILFLHVQTKIGIMGTLFQNKYRIETARYFKSDYNIGYFFVTFCTKKREHFFGEIKNQEMHLSMIGDYTADVIKRTPVLYPYCNIETYVIMPNHVHAIIYVNYKDSQIATDDSEDDMETNVKMQEIANQKGKLSVIVGSIKSAVTIFANKNDIPFGWQRRFHDHIIRNSIEYNKIFNYIENNVINWKSDCFWD